MPPSYLAGSRFGIRAFDGTTPLSDIDVASQTMRDDIESKMLGYSSGLDSALPAAGTEGRIFRATDTGRKLFDTGARWEPLGLAFRTVTGTATARNGELVNAGSGSGYAVTLPSPTVNAVVGVFVSSSSVSGAAPITVQTAGADRIYGDGMAAVASLKLGVQGAHIVLQSDGSNWVVVSGQQDSGWITLSLQTGWSSPGSSGGGLAAYRLTGDRVMFRGIVQNTSGSTSATNTQFGSVSTGYRSVDIFSPFVANANNTGTVNLSTAGAGVFNVAQAVANNGWFSLEGLTYLVS